MALPGSPLSPEAQPGAAPFENGFIEDWPLRPWVLGALLALAGFLTYLLTDGGNVETPWRMAGVAAVIGAGLAAAFTLNLRRPLEAAGFALLIGLVLGGIAWHVVEVQDHVAGEEYAFAAAIFFGLLALPLFQADFHRTRLATDYRETHFHVWSDAVSGGGAIAFTGLSWLLLVLLDQLFRLVGIHAIGDVMDEGWFGLPFTGGAFGAGLGVLRNNLKVIGALQNVVMLVFALLAVPLAAALVVFLVILLASGGKALWDANLSATPVLLSCAAGSFVLANAVIRDTDAAKSGNRIMQIAAAVLASVILPLVVFAAISMGLRIDQHGLTPERIWALIAIAVASAYGLAAWDALVRGRRAGWAQQLRLANLKLAAGVCVLALVLALPLADFGAISARSQVARLHAGKVSADAFDYAALRWDFGDAGRAVLAELAAGEGRAAELAAQAQRQTQRIWNPGPPRPRAEFAGKLRVQPDDPALRERVLAFLETQPWRCSDYCVALDLGEQPGGTRRMALVQGYGYDLIDLPATTPPPPPAGDGAPVTATVDAVTTPPNKPVSANSKVEIREERVRVITVDGHRIGSPLD